MMMMVVWWWVPVPVPARGVCRENKNPALDVGNYIIKSSPKRNRHYLEQRLKNEGFARDSIYLFLDLKFPEPPWDHRPVFQFAPGGPWEIQKIKTNRVPREIAILWNNGSKMQVSQGTRFNMFMFFPT